MFPPWQEHRESELFWRNFSFTLNRFLRKKYCLARPWYSNYDPDGRFLDRHFFPMDVLSPWMFCPPDVMSPDVLSPGTFCLTDVLSVRMFCPAGNFVPMDVLSTDVLSPDVLSGYRIYITPQSCTFSTIQGLYRRESNPVVSSVKIILIFCVRLAYCNPCGNWKFLAVRLVSFDDPS
jgi:hypothetical protein